ncbi:hypothetical protein IAT38_003295 [Cryptococcus sp. DSM 104549]
MTRQHPRSTSSLNHTLVPMASREQADRAEALLAMSIALVDSAVDVLTRDIKTDEELGRDSALLPGGTVGKHFRHVIECFRAFLLPLYPPPASQSTSASAPTLEINYDAILPSTRRPIARSLPACRQAMTSIRDDLAAWGEACRARGPITSAGSSGVSGLDGPGSTGAANPAGLGMQGDQAHEAGARLGWGEGGLASEMERSVRVVAITPTRQEMTSTLGRELWYCSLHSIHHFSMLRTIAVFELGLQLPVEFGTAPSTLLYRGLSWEPPTEKEDVKVIRSKL